ARRQAPVLSTVAGAATVRITLKKVSPIHLGIGGFAVTFALVRWGAAKARGPRPRLDGYARTSPGKAFPPRGYGLYDRAGSVWRWCDDWFLPDASARSGTREVLVNPRGPDAGFDPRVRPAERVRRGGSFLCCAGCCFNYRPSARLGCTPDTGMSHVGFRCVLTP